VDGPPGAEEGNAVVGALGRDDLGHRRGAGRQRPGPPLCDNLAVITGYNTDVKFKGLVYHVQTEDKGKENPLIETLIYKGGEILASRRLPYAELVRDTEAEPGEAERHGRLVLEKRGGRAANGLSAVPICSRKSWKARFAARPRTA